MRRSRRPALAPRSVWLKQGVGCHSVTAAGVRKCFPARRRLSDRLLNAAEVAELLAVPESWVREHTRNGSMPHIQLGRYIRYRGEAVLTWIDSLETSGGRASRMSRRAPRAQEAR